jgi:hypothetical protein
MSNEDAGNAPVDTGAPDTSVENTEAAAAPALDTGAESAAPVVAERTGTIAGSEPDDSSPVTPDWPDDWREKLAGKDDKMLARLKRFQSPANVLKSWRELEQKISSGEFKKQPGKEATPEQLAEWRKENGIPEKPDDYKFDLGGFIPAEADKPILEGFKALAHEQSLSPDIANKMVGWYFQQQEQAVSQQVAADKEYHLNSQVELRAEWGPEFRVNVNAMNNFLDATMPEGLKDRVFGARLADGKLLGDDPHALRWLAQLARDMQPGADLVPSGTPNIGKGIHDQITEYENMMSTDYEKYYTGGYDKKLLQLYDARTRMKG